MKFLLSLLIITFVFAQDDLAGNDRCIDAHAYYREWDVEVTTESDGGFTKITYNVSIVPSYPTGDTSDIDTSVWQRECESNGRNCKPLYSFSVAVHPDILGNNPDGQPYIASSNPTYTPRLTRTYTGELVHHSHSAVLWDFSGNPMQPGDEARQFSIWVRSCVGLNRSVFQTQYIGKNTRCAYKCVYAPRLCDLEDPCYIEGDDNTCGCCEEFDSDFKEVCGDCACACC